MLQVAAQVRALKDDGPGNLIHHCCSIWGALDVGLTLPFSPWLALPLTFAKKIKK
jgi:hypothetical protein